MPILTALSHHCHKAKVMFITFKTPPWTDMNILFICTHNRCRSILAEAIFNHVSKHITAASAGSSPVDAVHPLTIKHLQQEAISTDNLTSQSWHELENFDPDLVITVCDKAAGEPCPLWFGEATKIHWGLTDPSAVVGSESAITTAFKQTITDLKQRAHITDALINSELDFDEVVNELRQLARC